MLHRLSRRRLLALVAGLLISLLGAAAWTMNRSPTAPAVVDRGAAAGENVDPPPAPTVLVFVSGAVAHAGMYRLIPSARVADALAAAGGITAEADPGHLPNEAAAVHDGRQVNVPFLRGRTGGTAQTKLDINAADVEELRALPGMPLGLAEAIVDHRARWGAFASLTELRDALGVDRATVTALGRVLRVVRPP